MAENSIANELNDDTSWIILRPPDVLMELPLNVRWEVTRRHPYYLRFWEAAHRFHSQNASDAQQRDYDEAAAILLSGIGVSGDPPAPSANWESLTGGQLSRSWVNGAISVVQLRGVVAMLLFAMPREGLADVARLLLKFAESNGDDESQRYETLIALQSLKHTALDDIPSAPIVSVNLQAPQRTILQAMEERVRQWKQEKGIPERRRRDDKIQDYLAVFDLREGWVNDHYDGTREQTLRKAASHLGISLSTACNRYKSAFRLISGRDYSPEVWVQLFGPWKLGRWLTSDEPAMRARRRPRQSRRPRPVPETTLATPSRSEDGFLNALGITAEETGLVDLVLDARTLIEQGRTNEQILADLELAPKYGELIDYLRERDGDKL